MDNSGFYSKLLLIHTVLTILLLTNLTASSKSLDIPIDSSENKTVLKRDGTTWVSF